MEQDDIRDLYEAIGGQERLKGSYEKFEQQMVTDEKYRKVVFRELGGNEKDTDNFTEFNNSVLSKIKKKSPSGTESNQSGSKAQSISKGSQQGNQIPNTEAPKTEQTNQLDQFTDSLIEPSLDITKTQAQAEPPKQKEKSIAEIMGMMPKSILPEGASPSQEQAQREIMKPMATSILQYGSEKPLTKPKTGMFDGVPTLVVPKKDKAKYGDEFEGQKVMTDEELFQTTLTKYKTETDRELLSEKENIALDLLEDKVKTGLSNTYLTKPLQAELGLLNQINELQALPPSEENAQKLTNLMFEKDKLESKRIAPILSYIRETDAVIAQYDELIKNSKGDTSSWVKDREKLLKKRNELSDDTKPFFQRAEEKLAELNETVFADPRYDNLTPQGKLQRYLILKHDELQDLKRQQAQEKGTNALTATGFAINELLNALDMNSSSVSPEIREIERELSYLAPTAFLNIAPRLGEELEPERLFKQIPAQFSDYLKWADTKEQKATIIRDALNKSYISSSNMNPDVTKTLETQEAPTWREPNFYGDLLASSTAIGLKLAGGNVGLGVAKAIKPIGAAYERLMNVSKVFKTAKAQRVTREALDTSVKFKTAGMLFDGESEELNGFTGAFNGLASAVVSPALANMANKLKSAILKKAVTPLSSGVAETTQETSEMIGGAISAFVDSGELNDFLEPIKNQVGTLDKAAGFVISTFGMGMAFGIGKSVDSSPNPYLLKAMEDYMKLPLDQQQQVDRAINAMTKDADAKDVLNMTEAHAEDIMNEVRQTVKDGNLTEEEAEQIKSDLTVAVRVNERVPADLPIEKKANIVSEIGAKIALEDKMKTSDKVFHDDIKADIEVIDQIIKTKLSIEEQGQTKKGGKKEIARPTKETAQAQTEQGAVGATEQGQQSIEDQPIGTESLPAIEGKPIDGEGVLGTESTDRTGLVLYHGSPHSFKGFDMSKLGSGEGKQAFGSGLYFTNEVDIAKGYANTLGSKKNFWEALQNGNEISLSKEDFDFLKNEVDALGFDGYEAENANLGEIKVDGSYEFYPEVIDALAVVFSKNAKSQLESYDLTEDQINKFLEIKKKISDPQLYKIAVHEGKAPSEYDYIDWREPLNSDQLKKIGGLQEGITGEQAYKKISKELGGDQKASEFLLSKGVDGITYKSNKGTGGKTGVGRNYVVFDASSIRIDEINEVKQPLVKQPASKQTKPIIEPPKENVKQEVVKEKSFNRQQIKELLRTKNYVKEHIPQIQKSIINNLKDGSDLTIAEAKFLNENALDEEIAKLKKELDESITKDTNNLNSGVGIPFNTIRSFLKLAAAYAKKGVKKLSDAIKITGLRNKAFLRQLMKEKSSINLEKTNPIISLKTYNANKIFTEIWEDVDLSKATSPEEVLEIIKEAAAAVITVKNNSKGNKKDFDAVIDLLRENYIDIKANGVGGIEFLKKKLEDYKAEQNKAISIKDKYNAKDWLIAFMSDKMLGIKYLTEAARKKSGGVLEDEYNIYDLFDLVIGKASNELSKLRTELFGSEARVNKVTQDKKSFVYKYLNSKGISVDDFNSFLKAQHMREFNERAVAIRKMQNDEEIAKQKENIEMYNKGDFEASTKKGLITKSENIIKKLTDENYSDVNGGFSSDEADKRMAEIKKDTERYENLQQAYKEFKKSVLDRNIEESFESGLIDEETRNRLIKGESMTGVIFDLYVPLKVREDVLAAEKKDSGLGSFFGFKKIKGTTEYSEFLRVDPFQQSVAELEATIKAKHKNVLYNHFFDFMERFPNEDLYELVPQKKDERGRDYTEGVNDKNSVQMKRKGRVFYLKFNHPKLRRTLINDFWTMPEGMRKVISAGNFFMNFKRMNLTTRNIDFTLPNWIRDSMSVLVNSTAEEKEGLGREIFKQMAINSPITITREGVKLNKINAVPALRTALGYGTEEDQIMFDEMGVEGSFVGYMNYAKGDLAIQELSDAVEKAEGGGNIILNSGKTVIAAIDYINTAVELSTRFAVYKACRNKGYSKQQSAVMAKNIGINFNRKGELGGIVNMLYLFSNAGIQDTSNFARRITKSRKMQGASLALVAGAYAFTALQYALMDEEEIDKNQFKIQQYFLFPTGKKDRYISMPKAYGGIRVLDQMGRSLYEVTHKEKSPLQAGGELWDAFLSFANPVSGSTPNWQSGLVPTIPKAFVEVNYLNKDWKNSPILPETYGKEVKDADNYFDVAPGESTFHITTAKQLEKLGMDISPETIEYLFDVVTGGMIGVTKNATTEAYQLITDPKKELDFNNVPVVRRFISITGKKDWGIYLYFRDNAKKGKVSKEELDKLLDYGYKSIKNGTMKFKTGERKIKDLLNANGYDDDSVKYLYHHNKLVAMDPEK